MGFRFQRAICLFAAGCAAVSLAVPRVLADDFNAEQIAKKFTPSVMLVVATSSAKPEEGALGTAFVLSEDGIVCTNFHVIDGQDKFVLRSSTGGMYAVTAVLATDKKHDIAILKADARGLVPLEFADAKKIAAGQKLFVIGNPEGFESSITEGIVSSRRDDGPKGPAIQISAAISHGSSGSPVFNAQGQVIGMATYFYADGQSLNFAIPCNELADLLATARSAKTAGTAETAGPGAEEHLYEPDPSVHGSKTQDTSVFKDPRFAKLKEAELSDDAFEMLSDAKALVKDYPLSSAASRAMSDAYYYASMQEDAFKAAKRALDLDPDSPRAWNNLAILYNYYTDDIHMVSAIYDHAMNLAPDDVKLLIDYAHHLRKSNRETAQGALNHAKRLLRDEKGVDDETRGYHFYAQLVNGYSVIGLNEDAYNTAMEFLNKTTSDAWLYLAYANAAWKTNRNTYVKATIDKAISLDPACKKDALQLEADIDYSHGDADSAVALLKQACTIDSRDFYIMSDLVFSISGKAQLAQGDYQDIDKYIAQLKAMNPKAGKEIEDEVADIIRRK